MNEREQTLTKIEREIKILLVHIDQAVNSKKSRTYIRDMNYSLDVLMRRYWRI